MNVITPSYHFHINVSFLRSGMSEELERLLLTIAEPARLHIIIIIIMTIVISLVMVMMMIVCHYLYDLEPLLMIHAQVFHGRGDSGIPGAF